MTRPASLPGRLLEPCGDARPRGMAAHDRTRLIGRLHVSRKNGTSRAVFLLCVYSVVQCLEVHLASYSVCAIDNPGDRCMSRRLLELLVVCLAFASSIASAVALNPRGIGQVLIYPYYTVNAGQDTLFTLVNTADTAKVVRVRFLEGYNGRTVFATYVFLSAHDVWTAAITQVADDDGAKITTADASCTFPALPTRTATFTSDDYGGSNDDTGPTSITRTREGEIEVIEAGDIVPGSAAEAAITHVQNGQPGGGVPPCTFATGAGAQPIALADLAAPSGGLYGSGAIVNVQ